MGIPEMTSFVAAVIRRAAGREHGKVLHIQADQMHQAPPARRTSS
jgi:hypothetical protein